MGIEIIEMLRTRLLESLHPQPFASDDAKALAKEEISQYLKAQAGKTHWLSVRIQFSALTKENRIDILNSNEVVITQVNGIYTLSFAQKKKEGEKKVIVLSQVEISHKKENNEILALLQSYSQTTYLDDIQLIDKIKNFFKGKKSAPTVESSWVADLIVGAFKEDFPKYQGTLHTLAEAHILSPRDMKVLKKPLQKLRATLIATLLTTSLKITTASKLKLAMRGVGLDQKKINEPLTKLFFKNTNLIRDFYPLVNIFFQWMIDLCVEVDWVEWIEPLLADAFDFLNWLETPHPYRAEILLEGLEKLTKLEASLKAVLNTPKNEHTISDFLKKLAPLLKVDPKEPESRSPYAGMVSWLIHIISSPTPVLVPLLSPILKSIWALFGLIQNGHLNHLSAEMLSGIDQCEQEVMRLLSQTHQKVTLAQALQPLKKFDSFFEHLEKIEGSLTPLLMPPMLSRYVDKLLAPFTLSARKVELLKRTRFKIDYSMGAPLSVALSEVEARLEYLQKLASFLEIMKGLPEELFSILIDHISEVSLEPVFQAAFNNCLQAFKHGDTYLTPEKMFPAIFQYIPFNVEPSFGFSSGDVLNDLRSSLNGESIDMLHQSPGISPENQSTSPEPLILTDSPETPECLDQPPASQETVMPSFTNTEESIQIETYRFLRSLAPLEPIYGLYGQPSPDAALQRALFYDAEASIFSIQAFAKESLTKLQQIFQNWVPSRFDSKEMEKRVWFALVCEILVRTTGRVLNPNEVQRLFLAETSSNNLRFEGLPTEEKPYFIGMLAARVWHTQHKTVDVFYAKNALDEVKTKKMDAFFNTLGIPFRALSADQPILQPGYVTYTSLSDRATFSAKQCQAVPAEMENIKPACIVDSCDERILQASENNVVHPLAQLIAYERIIGVSDRVSSSEATLVLNACIGVEGFAFADTSFSRVSLIPHLDEAHFDAAVMQLGILTQFDEITTFILKFLPSEDELQKTRHKSLANVKDELQRIRQTLILTMNADWESLKFESKNIGWDALYAYPQALIERWNITRVFLKEEYSDTLKLNIHKQHYWKWLVEAKTLESQLHIPTRNEPASHRVMMTMLAPQLTPLDKELQWVNQGLKSWRFWFTRTCVRRAARDLVSVMMACQHANEISAEQQQVLHTKLNYHSSKLDRCRLFSWDNDLREQLRIAKVFVSKVLVKREMPSILPSLEESASPVTPEDSGRRKSFFDEQWLPALNSEENQLKAELFILRQLHQDAATPLFNLRAFPDEIRIRVEKVLYLQWALREEVPLSKLKEDNKNLRGDIASSQAHIALLERSMANLHATLKAQPLAEKLFDKNKVVEGLKESIATHQEDLKSDRESLTLLQNGLASNIAAQGKLIEELNKDLNYHMSEYRTAIVSLIQSMEVRLQALSADKEEVTVLAKREAARLF